MCECACVWGRRGVGKEETVMHVTSQTHVLKELTQGQLGSAYYQVLGD